MSGRQDPAGWEEGRSRSKNRLHKRTGYVDEPHGSAINPDSLAEARLGGHDDLILEHHLVVLFGRAMRACDGVARSKSRAGWFGASDTTAPGARTLTIVKRAHLPWASPWSRGPCRSTNQNR